MRQYTFTFSLAEQKESLPIYHANDMEDVEMEVKYSIHGSTVLVNQVLIGGVDIAPVMYAFKEPIKFINRLAEDNWEMRKVEKMAKNYSNIHRNAMADAYERKEMQKLK